MVTYRNVTMQERSRVSRSRLRLRSSHHKIAPLRISHRGVIEWTPPVKDEDVDDRPRQSQGKKRK